MNKQTKRSLSILLKVVIAILGVWGVAIQLGITQGNFSPKPLAYFTNLSNLLVVIYMVYSVVYLLRHSDSTTSNISFMAIVTMGITLTMVVAQLLLRGVFKNMTAEMNLSMNLLHLVVPCLTILDYFLFDEKGKMTKQTPWVTCVFPLGYVIYAMVAAQFGSGIGTFTQSRYPYPFLDTDQLGWPMVLGTCVLMTVLYYGLAWLWKKLDTHLGNKEKIR